MLNKIGLTKYTFCFINYMFYYKKNRDNKSFLTQNYTGIMKKKKKKGLPVNQ